MTVTTLSLHGLLGGLNRMLNWILLHLWGHTVGLIKLNCLCPHPYLTETKRIWFGTKPVKGVEQIPLIKVFAMNGLLCFLPSMTFRPGISQLLCASPGNLPLTMCTDLLDQDCQWDLHEKGVGPAAGVCCPISLSAEAFLCLARLSDVQVRLGSAYTLSQGHGYQDGGVFPQEWKLLSTWITTCSSLEPTEVDE